MMVEVELLERVVGLGERHQHVVVSADDAERLTRSGKAERLIIVQGHAYIGLHNPGEKFALAESEARPLIASGWATEVLWPAAGALPADPGAAPAKAFERPPQDKMVRTSHTKEEP